MSKRFIFFCSLAYAYPILRPIQERIRARGDEAAWYLEPGCENLLDDSEHQLHSIEECIEYNPTAIFTPGNYIYYFLPGVKVAVFHGYPIAKRGEKSAKEDDHFKIRGAFDMYCTQGPSSTLPFTEKANLDNSFRVYETGWPKVDSLVNANKKVNDNPTILFATTFSKSITCAPLVFEQIQKMVESKTWNWKLTFHPKFADSDVIEQYHELADKYEHVSFERHVTVETIQQADVLLCDSSSIILEFLLLDKPVVTFNNTNPGPQLINVTEQATLPAAIDEALSRPKALMENIHNYMLQHEAHRDGLNSMRVLDAVDDFIAHQKSQLTKKPMNLWRKLKQRKRAKYWKW